jgi:hypothetical protein
MDDTNESPLVDDGSESPSEEAGAPANETSTIALPVTTDIQVAPDAEPDTQLPPEPDLLAELATAMHAASARERERLETAIAERSSSRVEDLHARARAESEELRRLADVDVNRIDEWAAAEIDRIRVEARRRGDERRAALDGYLSQHDAAVQAEISRIGKAVAVYRERLDAFFTEVDATEDPAAIARLAGSLPSLPYLEDLPEEPAASTVADVEPPADDAEAEALPTEAARAEGDSAAEARAEIEASAEPVEEQPLVGVMAPAAPAPVSPLTAIVSAPPTGATIDEPVTVVEQTPEPVAAASEQAEHRGAFERLRTIAPWSRHDDRDATA